MPVAAPEFTPATLPLRIITFVLKLPFIILTTLQFLLVDSFFRFTIGSVSRKSFEILRCWAARAVLFACGFYRLPISYDTRKASQPKSGDIIVTNQSSPIDILILTYLYPSCVFTSCDNEMLFQTHSAVSAFLARFQLQRVRKGCSLHDFTSEVSNLRDRVILVFPEGTTSNNRGLLSFCPIMLEEAFVTSIKYDSPAYLSTPIPHAYWNFLWSLASVPSHGCRVKSSSQKLHSDYADALARFGRMPKTSLGIDDKESFLEAWKRR